MFEIAFCYYGKFTLRKTSLQCISGIKILKVELEKYLLFFAIDHGACFQWKGCQYKHVLDGEALPQAQKERSLLFKTNVRYARDWAWFFVGKVAALQPAKIVWPDQWTNNPMELMSLSSLCRWMGCTVESWS
jgi:hypothetical protein